MGTEGDQQYEYTAYNLDVIISVGYRVKSQRGTRFCRWANKVLKEYLLRGYAVNSRIVALEQHAVRHDAEIHELQNKVDFFVRTSLPPVEGIFFDGQIFDAYTFVSDLVRSAKKSIVLFDNYVDDTVLTMLDKRKAKVSATIIFFCRHPSIARRASRLVGRGSYPCMGHPPQSPLPRRGFRFNQSITPTK